MTGDSLLTFPCDLPIKVFGRNEGEFREAVRAIVAAHYPEYGVAEQPSRKGNYLSLTITVHADSREQVDALYQALVASDETLMVL
jgi:hypothetical protein